jgi:predicted nucleotidyltransferase
MAQIPADISSIIDIFLKELEKENISVERAILFGSYAQGTNTPWSDIDLALFSSAFEGDRFKDRNKIRRIKLQISSSLEPIPFPSDQYFAADPFVEQIKKTGISVFPKNH